MNVSKSVLDQGLEQNLVVVPDAADSVTAPDATRSLSGGADISFDRFEALDQAAQAAISQQDWSTAQKLYLAGCQAFPKQAAAYRNLGVVQERLQDFDGEISSYETALQLDENQPYWLYVTLAHLISQQGRTEEAIALYQTAIHRYFRQIDGISFARYAKLLSQMGQYEAAQEAYEQGGRLQPELKWIHDCQQTLVYNQGVQLIASGQIKTAESAFAKVDQIEKSPESLLWFKQSDKCWPNFSYDCAQEMETRKPQGLGWPRITVVTPSFNQGHFIEETMLSVLNQNYPALEYIVVDGGSSDNTEEVLQRYRARLHHLIIEPDQGQSDAINKGFKQATGELLTWLNSDDMLAPGALHRIALAYLESFSDEQSSDIVAGICIAHQASDIVAVRKPRVRQETFTLTSLANIAGRWTQGEFFYQPEVFFSRAVWERAGARLDCSLHYSMDHDLWMRFAQVDARLQIIDYPVALFRKHNQQKTAQEAASREELLQMTRSYHRAIVDHKVEKFRASQQRVLVVSTMAKYFALGLFSTPVQSSESQMAASVRATFQVCMPQEMGLHLNNTDAVVICMEDQADLEQLKSEALEHLAWQQFEGLRIAWSWSPRLDLESFADVLLQFDVYTPGQTDTNAQPVEFDGITTAPIYPGVFEWSSVQIESWFERFGLAARGNGLRGEWFALSDKGEFAASSDILDSLVSSIPGFDFRLWESKQEYFSHPGLYRFQERLKWPVSFCFCSAEHQDQTLLEIYKALLCGQVPLLCGSVTARGQVFEAISDARLRGEVVQIDWEVLKKNSGLPTAFQQTVQTIISQQDEAGVIKRYKLGLSHGLIKHSLIGIYQSICQL